MSSREIDLGLHFGTHMASFWGTGFYSGESLALTAIESYRDSLPVILDFGSKHEAVAAWAAVDIRGAFDTYRKQRQFDLDRSLGQFGATRGFHEGALHFVLALPHAVPFDGTTNSLRRRLVDQPVEAVRAAQVDANSIPLWEVGLLCASWLSNALAEGVVAGWRLTLGHVGRPGWLV